MTPQVSILTPTYNHEAFIAECIESVLSQDFTDWEMLVLDDGSTDRTAAVVQRYADPRIRLIVFPHEGIGRLGAHYNFGVRQAQGEYLAILEGDDRWYNRGLREHLRVFDDPAVVMAYGCAALVNQEGSVVDDSPTPSLQRPLDSPREANGREFVRQMLLQPYSFVPTAATLIRRSALCSVGGFWQPNYYPSADYGTWLRLGMCGRAVFVPGVVAMWRQHQTQVTSAHSIRIAEGALRTAVEFLEELSEARRRSLGVDRAQLMRARRGWVSEVYWAHALAALRAGDAQAERYLAGVWQYGTAVRRAEAAAAFALRRLGANPALLIELAAGNPIGRWLAQRWSSRPPSRTPRRVGATADD